MSAAPVRRRKNRKTNTSLGIPHTFSFPLLPTHECRAVNLHMMTLKILFHMDVRWRNRKSGGNEEAGGSNPLSSSIFPTTSSVPNTPTEDSCRIPSHKGLLGSQRAN